MADANQDKSKVNDSDIELDPIVQGVDRVHARQEEDALLESAKGDDSQDTQTRANIHLGSRFAEGEGLADPEGQGFTAESPAIEGDIVSGSPVHDNIQRAEVLLSENFKGNAEDVADVGAPITTAGTATSGLEFGTVPPTITPPQADFADAEPGEEPAQGIQAQAFAAPQENLEDEPVADGEDETVANTAPVANDDAGTSGENETFTIDVLANDTDVDNDVLFITDATLDGGVGAVSHDGTNITFNPGSAFDHLDDGETDTAIITYTISDGQGGTDTATLSLIITGSNDGPIVGPVDLGATEEDTSVTFSADDLLVNSSDVDGDELNVVSVTVAEEFGTITDNGDGTYTFNPAPDFNGDDVPISFTVTDGTEEASAEAVIDVTPVDESEEPPVDEDDEPPVDEDDEPP
ncbi:MAG: cadherin-like domain-containing protein, partial [Emcibacter sp.]|nr:cadherin-like domain-containing protein [Emcibacter sp.]